MIFMKSRQTIHLENRIYIDNNKFDMNTRTKVLRILVNI